MKNIHKLSLLYIFVLFTKAKLKKNKNNQNNKGSIYFTPSFSLKKMHLSISETKKIKYNLLSTKPIQYCNKYNILDESVFSNDNIIISYTDEYPSYSIPLPSITYSTSLSSQLALGSSFNEEDKTEIIKTNASLIFIGEIAYCNKKIKL